MILKAEATGGLRPGDTTIEPTSGNTGIGLAMVTAARGYKIIITMPESATKERMLLMKAFGAQVKLTPAAEGMPGAIDRVRVLANSLPNTFLPMQFENPANPEAHRFSTAKEIYDATDGKLDVFVASAGTGGTITGTGTRLRELIPNLLIAVVEPASSPVLSGGEPGPHSIPGMGPGFVPKILDQSVYHRILQVTDEEARDMARKLAREEGLLAGLSTGAVVCACVSLAQELQCARIVGVAPDTGERYLSTGVYA
jgi:cysteine synthase A